MKNEFYTLLMVSRCKKTLKGFSNTDNHGDFLLFPMEFSPFFSIGTFLESPTGPIRINEMGEFLIFKTNMLRLYYKPLPLLPSSNRPVSCLKSSRITSLLPCPPKF